LRRVLDCPDIDILCSPISYSDRGLGGSAPSMTAAESVALTGKMWLNEDDTHTYLATGTPPGSRDHVNTLAETNAELIRNVAQESLRNFATWWMDLGATGWFRDAGMWEQMAKLQALDDAMLQSPTPFRPEIAAVIDAPSLWRVAPGGQEVTGPAISSARAALGRIGAPYGQYLLDDVIAGKVHAKLYVFLNAWSLTAAEREKLLTATRGSVCVWCYAPGYFDGNRASPEAMQQLTGFHLRRLDNVKAWASPARLEMPKFAKEFGVSRPITPLFAADDPVDQTFFTYPDGSTAVAFKAQTDDRPASLFVGAPGLTSELLREAARRAGIHLYTETDCNVYANGHFIAIHASQDGPLEVNVGQAGPVKDLLSKELLGSGPVLSLQLRRGETRVLRVGP
jgi:hypothetical protein